MQNIEQEILAKNYQLSDFAEELLEGYQCLVNADVVIPENVFNPNIELGFFGVYAEFIASGDNELKQTLDYFGVIGLPTYVVLLPEKINRTTP